MIQSEFYEIETPKCENSTKNNLIYDLLKPFVGQEILEDIYTNNSQKYTAILDILKNFSPYSIPFLQKVSKREVPSYYLIVRNPMDLGTMTKKIKKYKTNVEFKEDLDLIWNNCVMFNGPGIYADYAESMRKKSESLYSQYFLTKNTQKQKNNKDGNVEDEVIQIQANDFKLGFFNNYKPKMDTRSRSSSLMLKFSQLKESQEAIRMTNNSFPQKNYNFFTEQYDLEDIYFRFHDIQMKEHNTFFSKKMKQNVNFKNIKLNKQCSMAIINQISCYIISHLGFSTVEKSAIKIYSHVICNQITKVIEKSKMGVQAEENSINLNGMYKIFEIPNIYYYDINNIVQFDTEDEVLCDSKDHSTEEINLEDDILTQL